MATILEIKDDTNTKIRVKTAPGSILKTEHADLNDAIADELLRRGVIQVLSTVDLSAETHLNTLLVLVAGVGFFMAYETADPADNEITFGSADAGWLWLRIITATDGRDKFTTDVDYEYILASGFMIDRFLIKPTVADDIRIGLTNGGEEIMIEETMEAGQWKSVLRDVMAEGGDVSIFFNGITDDTTIIIYKRKL